MKTAVLGAGLMGSSIAWDLSRSDDVDSVSVADIDEGRLAETKKRVGRRTSTTRVNLLNRDSVRRFLDGVDVAVSALPHGVVHAADVAAVDSGAKVVNIAFEDEQMELNDRARRRGAILIPGCGLAPGLSNILLAEGSRRLDENLEGHIAVGGLPQEPRPPLGYQLLFSIKGLIREYLSARVIRDGRIVSVEPFSRVDKVHFSNIGTLEAFYTDGLGSALYTHGGLKALDEKTLRWPGHAEKIKFLLDAGFFKEEAIDVGGMPVSPLDFSSAVLRNVLATGDPRDMTLMRVEVVGKKNRKNAKATFELLDRFDAKNSITSMGRTTGFTAAIVARMVGRGEIGGAGVIPPESALDASRVRGLLDELSQKGISVREDVTLTL